MGPPDSRQNFPVSIFILSQSLIVLGMTIPNKTSKSLFLIPISYLSLYLVFRTTTHIPIADFSIGGMLVSQLYLAFDYLLLSNPERDFRPLSSVRKRKSTEEEGLYNFWTRLKWAINVFNNRRGIGWNYQVSGLPSIPTEHVRDFIRSRIFEVALLYLVIDLIQNYQRSVLAFSPQANLDGVSISSAGLYWQIIDVTSFMIASYAVLRALHITASIVSVALNVHEPQDWPHLHGSFLEAYTIRRFWSRTWHQMLQRSLRTISRFVAHKIFRIPSRSSISYATKLTVSFTLSTLMHLAAETMVDAKKRGPSLKFFLVQPLGILFEEIVLFVARKTGSSVYPAWLRKGIGMLWVFCWFQYWLVDWVNGLVRLGFTDRMMVPLSVASGLMGGPWIMQ